MRTPSRPPRCREMMDQAEFFDQVARVEDWERTVTDQPIGAFRRLPIDVTRHREHGDAVLGRLDSGDQRPTGDPGLDDNHRRREAGNDPVPRWKSPGIRPAPRRILGDDRSSEFEDLIAEAAVLLRIRRHRSRSRGRRHRGHPPRPCRGALRRRCPERARTQRATLPQRPQRRRHRRVRGRRRCTGACRRCQRPGRLVDPRVRTAGPAHPRIDRGGPDRPALHVERR